MKKVKSGILEKIKTKSVLYTKINSNLIDEPSLKQINKEGSINLVTTVGYEIIEKLEDKLRIKYNVNVGFEPKVVFEMDIDVEVECILKESLDGDLTEDDANELLQNISSNLSLVIAFLTERLSGKPLVLPPIFRIGKE